jgi:large subunit ribosomal protein L5
MSATTTTPKKGKRKKADVAPPSQQPRIAKITVNIGVGEAGEKLKKAETVLQNVTGQKPVQTLSKTTIKDWGIRKFMPLGCKVTLRHQAAAKFLAEAFRTRENKLAIYSIDDQGNFSFGIPDHTLFEGQKYDPNIGIFGMDICVTMERPGYRVKSRRINTRKLPRRHLVSDEDTMKFLQDTFKVEVVE